ncbi:MAG TPA: nucleotidyltransferase domain-containing protein [Thermomicrobiales bacterium]|nr:nucleotidyltransferase domain-containing protein [Thermomicrobiales bacterium]
MARIPIPRDEVEAFCRKHHIRWLALFGSVLRDDFRDDSDVDVLVEFEPGHTPGWELFDMERELESILGRDVDLNMYAPQARERFTDIMREAEVQFAAC